MEKRSPDFTTANELGTHKVFFVQVCNLLLRVFEKSPNRACDLAADFVEQDPAASSAVGEGELRLGSGNQYLPLHLPQHKDPELPKRARMARTLLASIGTMPRCTLLEASHHSQDYLADDETYKGYTETL